MKKNVGTADRIVRIALAVVIGVLIAMGELSGTTAIVLGILAVIFLGTGIIRFCPIYYPFKLSTAGKSEEAPAA